MGDHPFYEVCQSADVHIRKNRLVFQKFTCEKCGERLAMDEPNTFYTLGHCEACNHDSDLVANGHNYMVVTLDADTLLKELGAAGSQYGREAVTDPSMTTQRAKKE